MLSSSFTSVDTSKQWVVAVTNRLRGMLQNHHSIARGEREILTAKAALDGDGAGGLDTTGDESRTPAKEVFETSYSDSYAPPPLSMHSPVPSMTSSVRLSHSYTEQPQLQLQSQSQSQGPHAPLEQHRQQLHQQLQSPSVKVSTYYSSTSTVPAAAVTTAATPGLPSGRRATAPSSSPFTSPFPQYSSQQVQQQAPTRQQAVTSSPSVSVRSSSSSTSYSVSHSIHPPALQTQTPQHTLAFPSRQLPPTVPSTSFSASPAAYTPAGPYPVYRAASVSPYPPPSSASLSHPQSSSAVVYGSYESQLDREWRDAHAAQTRQGAPPPAATAQSTPGSGYQLRTTHL
jgi:hypothetical protein